MRNDQEMLTLFLDFAAADPRIRAVGMEGSRLNPQVVPDEFQDFDLTYFVTDLESFTRDDGWLDRFGERLILQKPEGMELFPPEEPGFSYLMLFADFNKADLTLRLLSDLPAYLSEDRLRTILLDKDGRVPAPPVPTDADYWVTPPTARSFDDCCNEFWNLSHYVVRGICRGELFYAAAHLEAMREELFRMLGWEIGLQRGFGFSLGKRQKFLPRYLDAERMRALEGSCDTGSLARAEAALRTLLSLFRESSRRVAEKLGCPYPDYDGKVSRYLDHYLERLTIKSQALKMNGGETDGSKRV